ncbi:unnamed protein product [Anisakis simplex]|uniref:Uncharacterized protein n=1 Tax=Anisakis simplex TaxID=6269 RepID=A0A3P6QQW9_ANISI|nr:unnamed protein product [Anisakis simplex]
MKTLIEGDAPLPKRKVDKMSARLDKVHISPNRNINHLNWRKRHLRQETLDEIDRRLNDSSDDESSGNDDGIIRSTKREKFDENSRLMMSDELKQFIRRNANEPIVLSPKERPSPNNAVVPYVPRTIPLLSDVKPSTESHINEITENDEAWHDASLIDSEEVIAEVSFPDDSSVGSSSLDEEDASLRSQPLKQRSSELESVVEIAEVTNESGVEEDTDLEMDCS